MPSRNVINSPDMTINEPDPLIATGSPEYLALCSLVLSAVGINHTYNHQHNGLTVSVEFADAAKYHLERYFEENRGWPEPPSPIPQSSSTGNPPTLLIIGCLILFFLVTGSWEDGTIWFRNGAIDSNAVVEKGEWWRLVTALTLHADQVHLFGNCIIGGFVVHLLSKNIGYGLTLLLLITSGALGNFLNIIARDQVHQSVGFSTSIFAAIGLFSGMQILTGSLLRLRNILIPLGAGAGLLAMLGVAGERTDLGAHLFGFISGLGLGMIIKRIDIIYVVKHTRWQLTLFILTLGIILFNWKLAFD